MGLLREIVAPEPHAVAGRNMVRGKMDLHDHPVGRPNALEPNLRPVTWAKRECQTLGLPLLSRMWRVPLRLDSSGRADHRTRLSAALTEQQPNGDRRKMRHRAAHGETTVVTCETMLAQIRV
jgi:hypothetical protein